MERKRIINYKRRLVIIPLTAAVWLIAVYITHAQTSTSYVQAAQQAINNAISASAAAATAMNNCSPEKYTITRQLVDSLKKQVDEWKDKVQAKKDECSNLEQQRDRTCPGTTETEKAACEKLKKEADTCNNELKDMVKILNDLVTSLKGLTQSYEQSCGVAPQAPACKKSVAVGPPWKNNNGSDYLFLVSLLIAPFGIIVYQIIRQYKRVNT